MEIEDCQPKSSQTVNVDSSQKKTSLFSSKSKGKETEDMTEDMIEDWRIICHFCGCDCINPVPIISNGETQSYHCSRCEAHLIEFRRR